MSHETRLHTLGRMTASGMTDNTTTQSPYDPLFEDTEDRYWGLSDRDVPILIGAAAGKPTKVLIRCARLIGSLIHRESICLHLEAEQQQMHASMLQRITFSPAPL